MWHTFKQRYLVAFWSPIPAVIALGILSTYYFGLLGTYWAVTGEFTRWGGHILQALGVDLSDWGYFKIVGLRGTPFERVDGMMIIGMFGGALIAACMANTFKLRFPRNRIRIFQALIGGIVAGFGARLAMGCNLASFFTGIPQFSLHAWLFTFSTLIGVYFGNFVVLSSICNPKITLQKIDMKQTITPKKSKEKILFILGCFFLMFFLVIAFYVGDVPKDKKIPILSVALLFGLAFGFIISRAQICFTSAFRDLFLTGRGQMARAVVLGMMISTLGVFAYIMLGVTPKIAWAGPNVIIGGILFGFGIVVAGGCECGWMYRVVEGQVHYLIVGIGNVIGATLLAFSWDYYADIVATDFPKVNLLDSFGYLGGLGVNYLLLASFFLLILFLEQRYKNKLSLKE